MVIHIVACGTFLPVWLHNKKSTEVKGTLFGDAEVIQAEEYCAAQIVEAAGKTSRPSLAQYASVEEEVEGRKECSQWMATGERG